MKVDLDKWHHCDVDKEEFVKLLKKSDYQGFKHMFIFFGSLTVFGVLAYMTWGTWWSLLFFLNPPSLSSPNVGFLVSAAEETFIPALMFASCASVTFILKEYFQALGLLLEQ